jgi:hypothetical protein
MALAQQSGQAERGAGRRLDAAREGVRNQIAAVRPASTVCDERSASGESVAEAGGHADVGDACTPRR